MGTRVSVTGSLPVLRYTVQSGHVRGDGCSNDINWPTGFRRHTPTRQCWLGREFSGIFGCTFMKFCAICVHQRYSIFVVVDKLHRGTVLKIQKEETGSAVICTAINAIMRNGGVEWQYIMLESLKAIGQRFLPRSCKRQRPTALIRLCAFATGNAICCFLLVPNINSNG
uniref:Uncharacterized protein n=1 Tax=Spongospora subterranea TaxID=70186 RepID=A0A0H5R2S9_9EUKA|eukprot:CRZ02204.1 hypothetical protein [Spongospora subterranea]